MFRPTHSPVVDRVAEPVGLSARRIVMGRPLSVTLLAATVLAAGAGCSLVGSDGTCRSFFAACSPLPVVTTATPWPEGDQFTATRVDGEDELVPGTELTVRFGPEHELTVYAGCNHLTVTAHLEGDRIVADTFSATAVGCAPELLAQDAWIAGFFEDGPRWTLGGDELVLATDTAQLTLAR